MAARATAADEPGGPFYREPIAIARAPTPTPSPGPSMTADVRAAQAGDLDAFDRLYAANVGRVHALCLRMARDAAEAELLTQDVFVHAWQRLRSFREESAFGSWLHRLAVNVVLERWRADHRRAARLEAVEDLTAVPGGRVAGPAPGIEERVDLERAIASLPEGARLVLVLHDIEGYTHDEISTLCGIAPGTAKAQLHRARRLLRERLDR